jgi:hypothetical protein
MSLSLQRQAMVIGRVRQGWGGEGGMQEGHGRAGVMGALRGAQVRAFVETVPHGNQQERSLTDSEVLLPCKALAGARDWDLEPKASGAVQHSAVQH